MSTFVGHVAADVLCVVSGSARCLLAYGCSSAASMFLPQKITQVGTNAQVQPYGPNAGDAALVAARKGPLELREVHFSYPLRQNAPGVKPLQACNLSQHCSGIACLQQITTWLKAWSLQAV